MEGFVEPPLNDPIQASNNDDSDDEDDEEDDKDEKKGDNKGRKRPLVVFPSEDEQDAIERRVRQALAMRSHVVANSSSDDAMSEDPTPSDFEEIDDDSDADYQP